ncbi:MAG: amino acid ABC transporter substrate-binding protein [Treponemataceae bacterium]|nr:amino acid ABC transporter substrate-binding protein [Treponemataceae bacterium]
MKKAIKVVAVVCAVALALSFVGCKKGKQSKVATDESLVKVQNANLFVLGLDDSFPPYGYRDEDQNIVGYDIDLAKEVCNRLGVELKCQPIDWNSKEQELNTGKIDCIWNGFTINEERLAAMAFTSAYVDNSQVVVVQENSEYTDLASLAGKNLGLQAGSSAAEAVDGAEEFASSLKSIVEFKDNLTALMDLEIGGVDAVVLDVGVAETAIKNGRNFKILEEPVASEKYGVGFRKNDIALRDAVQKALEEMVADGTMHEIDMKWFGEDRSVIGK